VATSGIIRSLMKNHRLIALVALIILSIPAYFWIRATSAPSATNVVKVTRGTIVEQALAVGSIEPLHSISVTSTIPGTVKILWHDEGDFVKAGDPLLDIKPNPTPKDLDNARRDLQQKKVAEETAQAHLQRYQSLLQRHYVSQDDMDKAQKDYQTALLQRKLSEEQLALLAKGEATVAGQVIKSTVVSPINGFILTRQVDVGDPVVPQTESQSGNTLFTIANMNDLVFKGQANEIDVGKIREGMTATVTLGAFPDRAITGTVTKISLQSVQDAQNSSTGKSSSASSNSASASGSTTSPFNVGFKVTISNLQIPRDIQLRAGYSANAEITIQRAANVLMLPERVLNFEKNKVFAQLPTSNPKKPKKQEIKIGISDGINAQIISGLKENEKVLDLNPAATNSSASISASAS
jgi:HlyD family secretion protein